MILLFTVRPPSALQIGFIMFPKTYRCAFMKLRF